jgi:hypothetical protein
VDVRHSRFVRHALTAREASEVKRVDGLAGQLLAYLTARSAEIDRVHVHLAQSRAVQDIVGSLLRKELGFIEEVVLAPQEGFVTHARPDFFFTLGNHRGILAEVERGGTVTNNHDLKDLWKTHIASDAQHLFLIVPNANWNKVGDARERPYARVRHRLSSFFGDDRREVDVVSVHVFGYGRDAPH